MQIIQKIRVFVNVFTKSRKNSRNFYENGRKKAISESAQIGHESFGKNDEKIFRRLAQDQVSKFVHFVTLIRYSVTL